MIRLRPRVLALSFAVLAVAGLSAVATSDSGASAAPTAVQATPTLDWQSCQPSGYQCATLTVPLDYADASKGTIKLALTRLPALDPSQRIGSLLANPGGPGGSAIDFLHDWAPSLATTIRDHFDLVAFDPRGVGQSTPIVCHSTLQAFTAVDPSPNTQAGWEAVDAAAKTFADECAAKYGDYLNYVGTKNVARDMESIRVALGEDKLTYLGYSYGTEIGAVYADMYPDKVRAFVLDGAVDFSEATYEAIDGVQTVGYERGLSAYVAYCKTIRCFGNQDPETVIEGLIAQSEKKPLPSPEADRPAGPGEVLFGVVQGQSFQWNWPALTQAAALALQGDGSDFVKLADGYLERNPDGSYANANEAFDAVSFVDETCPHDLAAYEQMAVNLEKLAPDFGDLVAMYGLSCAHWQATPDPLTTPHAKGAAPIVVVSTTDDPVAIYEWGVALSKQLDSGHLITYRGYGHTAYDRGGGSDYCVDSAVNDYLINLTVPKAGLTCGTGPPPPEAGDTTAPSGSATPAPASVTAPAGPKTTATGNAPLPPSTGTSSSSKGSGGKTAVIVAVFVAVALAVAGTVVVIERRR